MLRFNKPIFRRHCKEDREKVQEYVALKDFTYHNVLIKAGEVVDAPIYVLKSMFINRKVGPKGHGWTNMVIQLGTYRETFRTEPVPTMEEVVKEVVVDTVMDSEPKKKRVRRTKAQIEADNAKASANKA